MGARLVVLLRAVNVGGTGKLPMAELRRMAEAVGFSSVQTYIASGNLVAETDRPPARMKAALETALADYAGKPVGVLVRTPDEIRATRDANPFPAAPPNLVAVIFLDEPPTEAALAGVTGRDDEEIALGAREIYVHYPSGMGRSKLKIPAAADGTARNMNTVSKLVDLADPSRP